MSTLGAVGEGLAELSIAPGSLQPTLDFGGDAANVCVMASRLGTGARIGGRVGVDLLGEALLGFWSESGVDVSHLRRDPEAATGLYLNEADADADHRFVYHRAGSAGSRLEADDLGTDFYRGLAAVLATGITLAISESAALAAEAALSRAEELGLKRICVLNHRPALGGDVARLRALAARCEIVIASREDAEAVFGVEDAEALAAQLDGGPDEILFSAGERGAVVVRGDEVIEQPAPQVRIVNTGGAGDALAGAYLAGRIGSESARDSLSRAVAASSLSVQRSGCAGSYPSAAEVAEQVRALPAIVERRRS